MFYVMLQSCERYISVNFSEFYRLTQNLFTCKVRNLVFIIRLLVVAIDCVADKSKLE